MKICVPTKGSGGLDDEVSDHFGRAPTFTLLDTESGKVMVIENRSDHMGGTGKPPEQIKNTGCSVVLASGMGPNAVSMLNSYGIQAHVGATGTARQAVEQYNHGTLRVATVESACKEHKH